MNLKNYWRLKQQAVNRALDKYLPKANGPEKLIHQAMRYSVFSAGKRIRPLLAIASYESVKGKGKSILPLAVALELIHTYSLVHDDLPAMDNDNYRRGILTCHKKFGEGTAILCGDALLTISFELLAKSNLKNKLPIIKEIARAAGSKGMVGGQMADLRSGNFKKKKISLKKLEYVNNSKTAALIKAAVKTGAMAAGASKKQLSSLEEFGQNIGLVFQIVDDILDHNGYASLLGKEKAKEKAKRLTLKAKRHLKVLGSRAQRLNKIADFILERKY